MKLQDEINSLIANLDAILSGLTAKWKAAATGTEREKWWALINKGLDERLELMAMRGK